MSREEEKHWVDLLNVIHDSVKGGMKYNTGTLLMVLNRPLSDEKLMEKDGVAANTATTKSSKKAGTPGKGDKTLNP